MSKQKRKSKNKQRIKLIKFLLFISFFTGMISSFYYFNYIHDNDINSNDLGGAKTEANDTTSPDNSPNTTEEESKENLETPKNNDEDSEKTGEQTEENNEQNNTTKGDNENKENATGPVNAEILISSAGDCTLGTDPNFGGNTFIKVFEKENENYSYFFEKVYPIFSTDDLTIVNLEGTFTDATKPANKKFRFKAPPHYANILPAGSIEGVNLANNHSMDFLEKGFNDTLAALDSVEIPYFGMNKKWVTTVKGQKFAFLGYQGWINTVNFETLKKDIQEMKDEGAIVIINFHWGAERHYHPVQDQIDVAHAAIDYGADLIVGHHPHVIEGFEIYKGKPIAYSLANFSFGGNRNPGDKRTFIMQNKFVIENDKLTKIGIKIIPARISSVTDYNNYQPTPVDGKEKEDILKVLNDISIDLDFKINGEFHYIDQ